MFLMDGEMFPIMKVKVLPVRESCSSRVSFDYRNEATDLLLLEREAITFPRVVSDWFMLRSYWKWSPLMF